MHPILNCSIHKPTVFKSCEVKLIIDYGCRLVTNYRLGPYLALDAVYLAGFNCTISNLYDKRDTKLLSSFLLSSHVLREQIGTAVGPIVVATFLSWIFYRCDLFKYNCLLFIFVGFFLQNETEHVCNIIMVFGIHHVGLRANRCQWVSNSNI